MKSIYVIGSLRNPQVPVLAGRLRELGLDVFDDWFAAGPEADDWWQKYEQARGHDYRRALAGYPATQVFSYDKHHLDRCDACVLLLPAGKSGHLELGYMIGRGKPGYIIVPENTDRWDVMYKFATQVFHGEEEFLREIQPESNRREAGQFTWPEIQFKQRS